MQKPNLCYGPLFRLIAALYVMGGVSLAAYSQDSEAVDSDEKACIFTDDISRYQIISDELVRLEMADASTILMRLKRHCPQLHFHKYMAFTPVNGRLCARFDDIITRSGTPCRIDSFSIMPDPATEPTATTERR